MAALLVFAIVLIIYYIYNKITSAHSYWQKKGIKGPKPKPLTGNVSEVAFKKTHNLITWCDKIYNDYPNEKVVGIYQGLMPTLLIRDPEIMKTILIKDFSCFTDRGIEINTNNAIGRHLFKANGDEWKTMRQKLTPLYTTRKLRAMMPLQNMCVEKYMEHLNELVDGTPREIRQLNRRYIMKSITSVAFGLDVDTYVEETTEFEKMANQVGKISDIKRLVIFLNDLWPGIVDYLHISLNREVADFFTKLVKEVVQEREGKPKVRNDFMDLLIELKEQGTLTRVKDDGIVEMEMTNELITAQAIVFYIAGFETPSGAMSFLLYELAMNPNVQTRCYEEIELVMKKYNGKLDYDSLKELPYLSMSLDEALRKYPIAGVLFRQAVTNYTFKDINLTIDKGTKILIPTKSVHMDPKYFPDPDKFDPERFLPDNKKSIHDFYMPFGDGPRNCIGYRFARVQCLLGMAHFLHNYKVFPCNKTPKKIQFDPLKRSLSSIGGIWLNIEKRK